MPSTKKQNHKSAPPDLPSSTVSLPPNTDAVKPNDDNIELLVRIKPHLKEWLEGYKTKSKFSFSEIVGSLIDYFRNQDELARQDILGVRVVHNFSKLVQKLEWANHAFHKTFWPWALEEYQEVEELAQKLNAGGITLHSRYKQAYCWLDIGINWEKKAIMEKDAGFFERAQCAILNALYLNQGHFREYSHKVIIFNIACAWSLLARISVEAKLIEIEDREVAVLFSGGTANWEKIGKVWRKKITDQAFQKTIDDYGQKALAGLKKMVMERLIPFDHSYLLEKWQTDEDLVFLRTDARFSDEFTNFIRKYINTVDLGQAFARLTDNISDSDRNSVHNWFWT